MRDLHELDQYRIPNPVVKQSGTSGSFKVQAGKRTFFVIASIDYDPRCGFLEHISVSHRNEKILPTWDEMAAIKDLFFLPEEECVQIHPKKSEYVNFVTNCLHIWRPVNGILFAKGEQKEYGI